MTKILKIDSLKPEAALIKEAANFIKEGKLVVFPTETVYGIGASAFDEKACKEIFSVKGRPSDNPLIIHVSSVKEAEELAEVSEYSEKLRKIWPSPITFIAKAKKNFPKSVTAGLDTIAIRMPAHPVALELIKHSGPIAAPSANPSKKPTATTAEQAIKYFNDKVECIIDSGQAFFGLESTIIDLRSFTILRPGPFTEEEIEKAFGKKPKINNVAKGLESSEKVISPGTKYTHYAPDTPLFLFSGKNLEAILEDADLMEQSMTFVGSNESCAKIKEMGFSTIELGAKDNLYEIAKNLYNALILLDAMRTDFGIVESFDEKGIGLAIMNRVRKASSGKAFSNLEEFEALTSLL